MKVCTIDGCETKHFARGLCQKHYRQFRVSGRWTPAPPLEIDGLGVCECLVSYPAPKCCLQCGYPSVHRMAPHIRNTALAKRPSLTGQTIVDSERGAA